MRRCRRCGHRNYGGGSDGGLFVLLAMVVLGIICMPIVGIGLMCTEDEGNKVLGGILFVVGIIICVAIGIH